MADQSKIDVHLELLTELNCSSCSCLLDISDLEPFSTVECPKCHNQERIPARFGEFLLLDLINTGGMGGVYRARDESLGRLVAIKVMLKSMGEDETFVARFKMEAQAAARLNHPKVAQIYSYGQVQNQPYIVMELVSGKGFDGMIDQNEQGMDPGEVFRIGLDIAEGLQAADEIGLTHGDIKPENILLDEKGNAKLVDFGLASYADQAASEGIWGTPYYIAPEKVSRKKGDARSDIFSLGATLFHALAGKPPFDGETPLDVVKARLNEDAAPLSEIREGISQDISDTITRMLQREPSQRHPTYKSVIADMRRILESCKPGAGSLRRAGGGGKRVVLKKRKSSIKVGAKPAPGVAVSEGGRIVLPKRSAPSALKQAVAQAAQPPEEVIAARKARKRKTLVLVLSILVLLLLTAAGIGVAIHLKGKEEKAIEIRRIQFERGEAIKQLTGLHAAVAQEAEKALALTAKFDPFVKRVSRAVEETTGDALELPPAPEPEPEDDIIEEEAPEPPEPEAAEVAVDKKEPAPVKKSAKRDSVVVNDDDGRDAPVGMPSRAAVERQRRQRHRKEPPAAAAAPAEAPAEDAEADPEVTVEPAAEEAPAPEPVIEGPEIRVLGMRVLMLAQAAKMKLPSIAKITRLADLILSTSTNAANADPVLARLPDLTAQREWLVEIGGEIEVNLEAAGEATLKVEALAAEERQRKKLDQQAQDDRRKEEERQAKIDAELSRAVALSAEASDLILRGAYEKALKVAERELRDYETEEGRAAAATVVNRCERLVGLRSYLIEKLNADPFRWGWVRGRNQREDVIGADKKSVHLKDRKIPWVEISKAQFVHFVEHYLSQRGTRRSVRGGQYLAAAIYCYENGGKEKAAELKEKAVESSPFLKEQADALLPDE